VGDKKQRISITERLLFWRRAKGKGRTTGRKWNWVSMLKVAVVIGLLVAAGFFFRYAEQVVKAANAGAEGSLILVEVPAWVNWDLKARVAAVAGGSRFPITDDTAAVVERNLEPMVWLDDVRIQVTHNAVRVKARWRKPVALIQRGSSKYYVDADLVVLDYMAMPQLPIVEIKGVTGGLPPVLGERFDRDDLAAAVALVSLLYRSDAEFAPKTPLLEQIASIDVANYKGRKHARDPHIILNTKEDTQVVWGAEIGEWAKYLEARDEEKLAKLYTHYKQFGSLSADVKYIYLRNPQDKVPQPIDKYRY
jgi:hypothetical protein